MVYYLNYSILNSHQHMINNYKYQEITIQSYYNRSSEIDISTYYKLSELISNYIKKTFYKDQKYTILVVDGLHTSSS